MQDQQEAHDGVGQGRSGEVEELPPGLRLTLGKITMAGHISASVKMVELQEGGERCQVVLGDLDAYNGKALPYGQVEDLAGRFALFARRLGFDADRGVIRSQAGHAPALETMYLLGRYVDQRDFDIAEEDNHAYYASRGIVDDTMTFRRALSLALMAADFVALGQQHDAVLVMLGVDEHRYVRFAQQAVSRFDEATPLHPDFALAAAYTRMVRGFGGHPKFSKSLPGSALDVGTPAADVRRLLADEPPVPEDSATYQLMCQLPIYDASALVRLHHECLQGNPAWRVEVTRLADYLLELGSLWPHGRADTRSGRLPAG